MSVAVFFHFTRNEECPTCILVGLWKEFNGCFNIPASINGYSPTESKVMMNENNDVFTLEDEPLATVVQNMRKGSKWLSAFLENYRPPLDGERYLTDREVAELLRVSRRTLQEYRNNRVLPFILLGGKVLYPESGLRELLEANYRKPME